MLCDTLDGAVDRGVAPKVKVDWVSFVLDKKARQNPDAL
jgi:hypothetical protein